MSESGLQWNDEIIAGCKQRNRDAQNQLYSLYADAMYNTAYRIVGNAHDAEDVLVMSFCDVFRAIDSYNRKATPGAWIKRIVINRSITTINKRKSQVELTENIPDTSSDEEVESSGPYEMSIIKKCIEKLAEGYRTILTLYLIEGYDHAEIANILNITVATSKSQYSRAKKRLKQLVVHSQQETQS